MLVSRYISLLILFFCAILISLSVGSTRSIGFFEVVDYLHGSGTEINTLIIWNLRFPRLLASLLTGSALGLSGALLQSLLRNSLAGPFLLGISSGSGLMTVLAIILGISAVYIPFFAWIGGMIASILVIFVASVGSNKLTTQKLILIGVALSSFLGAIQSILLLGTEDSRIQIALQWLIGSLNAVNWEVIKPAGLMILTSIIASKFMLKKLDLLNLDEPTAINFGLNLSRSRLLVGIVATCLSSCAVSIGGLIGFVGLISPHTARLLIGSNQPSKIIPASTILGAIFLSVADTISRSYTEELPVGAITALIGSPLFVFLLIHQSKKSVIN